MGISHKHKLIFIHIPKCAGSSINKFFKSRKGGHHKWDWYEKNFPKAWKKYWKFSVLRNPLDRFLSNYRYAQMEESYWHSSDGNAPFGVHPDYHRLKGKSLHDCVQMLINGELKYIGWTPQYTFICDKEGNVKVDDLYNINKLSNQFKEMGYNLPFVNISQLREAELSNENITKINKFYKKDLELWESIAS